MPNCCCIEVRGRNLITQTNEIYALTPSDLSFNDRCVWSFTSDQGQSYYLWYSISDQKWILSYGVNDLINLVMIWAGDVDCPIIKNEDGSYTGAIPIQYNLDFSNVYIYACVDVCPCLLVGILDINGSIFNEIVVSTALYNNRPIYNFSWQGFVFTIYFNGDEWECLKGGFSGVVYATMKDNIGCPNPEISGKLWIGDHVVSMETESATCPDVCLPFQERFEKEYESINLPTIFTEELRDPTFKCCETLMVLADPNNTDTWRNDVTSAWIKLSDPNDQVTITLTKSGQPTNYPVNIQTFVNEPNARYRTIYWRDVLSTDGEGCYKINIDFNIGGMTGSFEWGIYDLKRYTIERAINTARIRVIFNQNQQIEDINFTDSNVEDSIRFYGFIGNRQPNMELDNLIYQNRVMRSVKRENLDTYEILTDPYTDDVLRKLTDLYLLSENEMFISDYNTFNNSYKILDIPVIVEDSPEIDYLDQFQRKAKLSCIVSDKIKNKRTYY